MSDPPSADGERASRGPRTDHRARGNERSGRVDGRSGWAGDGRAVSSALDATLALVLVAAAVATLVTAPTGPPPADRGTDRADATAATLAADTAQVNYSLAPGARRADESLVAFPVESGPGFRRWTHGTIAALLARAAVGNASVNGTEITHTTDGLERAVADATRRAVRDPDRGVQVRAVWRPHPGSSLTGRVVVGPDPPGDAVVHAATLRVSSGMPTTRERAEAVARGGWWPLGRMIANATVEGLFPPERIALALRGDYPVRALAAYRYRRAALLFGANVSGPLAEGDVRAANWRLAKALIRRVVRDLRREFPTARTAARNVSTGTVTVVVRTWSS